MKDRLLSKEFSKNRVMRFLKEKWRRIMKVDYKCQDKRWPLIPVSGLILVIFIAFTNLIGYSFGVIFSLEVICDDKLLFLLSILYSIILAVAIITCHKYFKRKKSAVKWVIISISLNFFAGLAGIFIRNIDIDLLSIILRLKIEIVLTLIIPYMIFSERVKTIFINK